MTMNEDRIMGTARNLGGKVQEGVGRVTGDTKSQVEGIMNQAAGAAQDLYGQAKTPRQMPPKPSARAPWMPRLSPSHHRETSVHRGARRALCRLAYRPHGTA